MVMLIRDDLIYKFVKMGASFNTPYSVLFSYFNPVYDLYRCREKKSSLHTLTHSLIHRTSCGNTSLGIFGTTR